MSLNTFYFFYTFMMLVPLFLWIATSIWTILDAEKTPTAAWDSIKESKSVWIVIATLVAWPFGFLFYLLLVKRPLVKIAKEVHDQEIRDEATEKAREEYWTEADNSNASHDETLTVPVQTIPARPAYAPTSKAVITEDHSVPAPTTDDTVVIKSYSHTDEVIETEDDFVTPAKPNFAPKAKALDSDDSEVDNK